MKKQLLFIFLYSFLCFLGHSQNSFVLQPNKKNKKINFQLINNLIVVPVTVNGVELSFILDTGVNKTILFNIYNLQETLNTKSAKVIYIRGLGEGEPIEAIKSSKNVVKVGNAINFNSDLFVVYHSNLNFAPRLGVPIHGIIGYEIFKNLVVEINYANTYIRFYSPENYLPKKCKNCELLPLEFNNNKPYIQASVIFEKEKIPVKLLIDSGGSDALWIFENEQKKLQVGANYFQDFLGYGLNGSVYGKRSKMSSFFIKNIELQQVNVAFPDSNSTKKARQFKERNGSIAGNILKRFNAVYNYKKAQLTIKKNKYFNQPFSYNKSGVVFEQDGIRLVKTYNREQTYLGKDSLFNTRPASSKFSFNANYKYEIKPAYAVVELRDNSPAQKAGLQIGDVLLQINGKSGSNYSLQEIMQFFHDKSGKKIKLKVDRNGKVIHASFVLERMWK